MSLLVLFTISSSLAVGALLDALDVKLQACFLNMPQHTKLILSSHVSFSGKRKKEQKKIKATPASLCATPLCETERESNWCCHKRAHYSCSFNTAQKISPRNKCQLLPLWDRTVSVCWRKCRRLLIKFPKCLLASPSLLSLSPLQSFFGLLLTERFKTCRTVALEVISGHSFNESVISLA